MLYSSETAIKANDLLGYASLIAHAARKYKGDDWIQYDVNF